MVVPVDFKCHLPDLSLHVYDVRFCFILQEELIPLPPSSVPPEPPIVSTKSSSASQNSSGTSGSPTLQRRDKNDKSIKNSIKRISKRGQF